MIEATKRQKINIKDLTFSEPNKRNRIRPEIDFSQDISFPEDLQCYTKDTPYEVMNTINELDRNTSLFFSLSEITEIKNNDISWKDYIKRSSGWPVTGIGLLLVDCAEKARIEARDINNDELNLIKNTILQVASEEEDPNDAEDLLIVSEHPRLLVWMAEIITFKESTLSLTDFSKQAANLDVEQPLPIQRRF
jgi:hypothetical protein